MEEAGVPEAREHRTGEFQMAHNDEFDVRKSEQEWRAVLSPDQFEVLRRHGTERRGTSPFNHEKRTGHFNCAGCGQTLFESGTKFDSGTGWPSFYAPVPGAVATTVDQSHGMVRTEVHCSRCGGHLGHVFDDGPAPTGQRYCMNGAALGFTPEGPAKEQA
jgi:peptide-methionine (R)-S-oxide reductase